jgi:uncharacterized protein (DUF1800 family)
MYLPVEVILLEHSFLNKMRTTSTEHQKRVTHLLRRTQFGTTKQEVEQYMNYSINELVDVILDRVEDNPQLPISEKEAERPLLILALYSQMLNTKNPLQEKMTLFWHSHFTSSFVIVNIPSYMAVQNMLLRKHALGNFRDFTYDISKDPAMLYWLNNNENVKEQPNENFARELLELFTLGIGNYTEKDIEELARALTGWQVNSSTPIEATKGREYFTQARHDNDLKTIFGVTKNFDLSSSVDLIVSQSACAEFIVRKIWKKFVCPNPTDEEIQPAVNVFKENGLNIKKLFHYILTSAAFYANKNYHSVIKDPTELAMELVLRHPNFKMTEKLIYNINNMGMELMRPPNVAGWTEGIVWMNSNYFFARGDFISNVIKSSTYDSLGVDKTANKTLLLDQILDKIGLFDLSYTTKKQLLDFATTTSDTNELLQGILYLATISPEAQMK